MISERERQVLTLKEEGLTHEEISDEIGIARSTVDEYSRRMQEKYREAKNTVEKLEDLY